MPDFLRFGIPSLDKLIGSHGKRDYGIRIAPAGQDKETANATGICIIGPDGTGKSVFGLHLASQYLADCLDEGRNRKTLPKIYYISTDLNFAKALTMWENFALNWPFRRKIPFEPAKYRSSDEFFKNTTKIELSHFSPQKVVDFIQREQDPGNEEKPLEVCFIDLAATTAGDDWGFVHRLLALMQEPGPGDPHHLLIIDAVEGFETYAGKLDAFGEVSSRRARIAQLARLAVKKAHTLLIVEEMRTQQRLPEEFVTDTVVRIRNVEVNKYLRRTIEVEKVRGQASVRGQHPFSIRKGRGSTTGSQVNVDDLQVPSVSGNAENNDESSPVDSGRAIQTESSSGGQNYKYQDYLQVFPSLNYLNRAIMELTHAPRESPPKGQYAAFGIRYLDNMLGGEGLEAGSGDPEGEYDTRGLPCGTVTALIGDSLTQKTRLGRSFLSRCFYLLQGLRFPDEKLGKLEILGDLGRLTKLMAMRATPREEDLDNQEAIHKELRELKDTVVERVLSQDSRVRKQLEKCGVAVVFTTLDTHHEALAKEFMERGFSTKHQPSANEKLITQLLIETRTICRRMEIVDVPASTLVHIFEQNIRRAQRILLPDEKEFANYGKRFAASKRIRVVFDDFSAFRNTYHEVSEDPLFLPYLPFFLGREGVTALIIDTQSLGRPDLTLTERYETELRELVQHRLYTWRVPFFGDNRVAITAIPPFSPATSGAIRELRWESGEDADGSPGVSRSLDVNPHFELYTGLEEGNLQPVPIEIRFCAESQAFKRYLETEEATFAELFAPYKRAGQTENPKVFFSYAARDYNLMRDFCSLQGGRRLDYTLVFQVDEFWTLRRPKSGRAGAFRSQWEYLNTPTWHTERDAVADPYATFQPTSEVNSPENKVREWKRADFYDNANLPYVNYQSENSEEQALLKKHLDRVPFSWDFGFLLCKGNAWKDAGDLPLFRDRAKHEGSLIRELWQLDSEQDMVTVGDLWKELTKAEPGDNDSASPPHKRIIGWFEFLAACKSVAELQSYKIPSVTHTLAHAFDFSVFSPETFSCLVLEIWASEIFKSGKREYCDELVKELSPRESISQPNQNTSLLKWLDFERKTKDGVAKTLGDCLRDRYVNKHTGSDSPLKLYGSSLELYKTWLLLIEVIDFSELITNPNAFSLELKPRQVSASVIAARHWYKTACQFVESISEQELEANWVPVRLPGHFSIRGDWFLSVAGGSRSTRLADRALDLLGSKRANINRLTDGIGLPVRRLFSASVDDCDLRTRLITSDGKQLTNLSYKHLLKLKPDPNDDFHWLWRSNLYGYHNELRVWHRWLNEMIVWWHSMRLRYASSWTSCFEIYARLEKLETCGEADRPKACEHLIEDLDSLDTWREFQERVNDLGDSLKQVSVVSD